jgi:4-hydroxy-tetrahydrodipicolinate synthase
MKQLFGGVGTALVTPFKGGEVDYAAFRRLIERQIEMRADALVILGTTGEICTLSGKERRKVIKFALEVIADRVPAVFGIGGNDPTTIIALGRFVADSAAGRAEGNVGVMVTGPYYNKATQDGLYEFFRFISNEIRLPAIVYNIPGRTGINIEPATMAKIAALPFIAGIKEASGNVAQIADVVKACPGTAVYCGDDTLALPAYAVGCRGIVSVAGNIDVAPVKDIYTLYAAGKVKQALSLYQEQVPFYKSLFRAVNPIPIKYELAKMGLIKNELRLPLTAI